MDISNESAPQMVSFTLGNMMFEYDEAKTRRTLPNTAFLSRMPPVFSLIMTGLSSSTKRTVKGKTGIIPLGILPQAPSI